MDLLSLLRELQAELNLTYLFITHNLSVVEYISNRVAVMYVGQIVEFSGTDAMFSRPRHPYTEALLSAVPTIKTNSSGVDSAGQGRERIILEGDVADPANVPEGCNFHPRCPYVQDICRVEEPDLNNMAEPGERPHYARCHFADELQLQGVKNHPSVHT
ncbi:ABC transporter ATP-binding protein [Chloroflexi bacterium TSY]|nr:ABC transporter ATP-binding protein [Chloroflexi bacterium TSY]